MKKWTAALLVAFMVIGTTSGALAEAPAKKQVPPEPVELTFGEPETTVTQVASDGASADSSVNCTWIHTHITAYLPLGGIAYRFHHRLQWCWDGETITAARYHRTWVSHMSNYFYYRGYDDDQWDYHYGGNWTRHESWTQGRIDNCVPLYGCIGSYYPEITINVYANGGYSVQSSEG